MVKVLDVTQNTLFKRRPLQSTELRPEELYPAPEGVELELQSYAYADETGDFNNHIKFAIANQSDWIDGINTWYVYDEHARVVEDGIVLYPLEEEESAQLLKITQDTLLKRRPVQSSELSDEETFPVSQGQVFELQSYATANAQGDFNNHLKVALENEEDYIRGLNTWYVYAPHAQVIYDGKVVYPPPIAAPSAPPEPSRGPSIRLPGFESTFYLNNPIIPNGDFTWAEATKDGSRIPVSRPVVENIVTLAQALQQIRERFGNRPIIVTSWYRDPATNRRVGGSRYSKHLYGQAADIQVAGLPARQVAQALWSSWPGGLGSYSNWVHIDTGPRRRWYQ